MTNPEFKQQLVISIAPAVTDVIVSENYPDHGNKDIADTVAALTVHIAENIIKEMEN